MQEYELLKYKIGEEKFYAIDQYIKTQNNYSKYEEEMEQIIDLPYDHWLIEKENIKEQYNVILAQDVLDNVELWEKYDEWYNEEYLHRKIDIVNVWETYKDFRCKVIISLNDFEIAKTTISFNEDTLAFLQDDSLEIEKNFINIVLKNKIYSKFDKYLELPKISSCSLLLKEIYDNVCHSDINVKQISKNHKNVFNMDKYSDSDINVLKDEIKKYNLEKVIVINDEEHKITGYEDLETKFNDDRNLNIFFTKDTSFEI